MASLDTNEENCAKMSAPIPAGINVTFPNAAPEKSLATITAGCPVMLPCCSVPTDGTQTVDTTVVGIHTCGLGGRTVCWRKMRRVNAAGNSTVPYCLLGGQAFWWIPFHVLQASFSGFCLTLLLIQFWVTIRLNPLTTTFLEGSSCDLMTSSINCIKEKSSDFIYALIFHR